MDESFGAFNEAPVTFSESKATEETSDKDLNSEVDSPSIQNASETTGIVEESFGDFDEAPTTIQTTSEDPSFAPTVQSDLQVEVQPDIIPDIDEDFGDFNDFETKHLDDDVPPNDNFSQPFTSGDNLESTDQIDDEFGDFGDFLTHSEAQPAHSDVNINEIDDDFEEFGDFSQTVEATDPVPVISDPLIDRARALFSKIQINASQDAQLEEKSSDPEENPVSLTELVKSLLSENKVSDTEECNWDEIFNAAIHGIDMLVPSPPSVIFDPKAIHPYSHYSRSSILKSQEDLVSRKQDNFERPSAFYEQMKQGTDSNALQESGDKEEDQHFENVPVPADDIPQIDFKLDFTHFEAPLGKENSGDEIKSKSKSDDAQAFLKMIPDLSFMLSTKLVIPSE